MNRRQTTNEQVKLITTQVRQLTVVRVAKSARTDDEIEDRSDQYRESSGVVKYLVVSSQLAVTHRKFT